MLQLLSNNGIVISRLFSLRGRFLHLFSTSSTKAEKAPKSLADYLVKSLGFSEEEAIATSLKVSSPNSKRNPNSVVNFLRQNGFDDTHIKKLVSRHPNVLRNDVTKTLKPKIRILQGLGLSGSNLGEFVADCRTRVFTSLSKASIDFLTPILGTNKNVVKFLKISYWSLSLDNGFAIRNVTLVKNYGVSSKTLQKFLVRYPGFLQMNTEKLEEACAMVEQKLGISGETRTFITISWILASLTTENLELKYQIFRNYGWRDSDIITMMGKLPECLCLSETMLRCKLEFLVKKLGFEAGYIASNPAILNYSLEKRTVPRNAVIQVLKERKLVSASLGLYRALTLSESQFLNKYVIPYKDELPGLLEAYSNKEMDSFSRS